MKAYVYGEKRDLPQGFETFSDRAHTAVVSIDIDYESVGVSLHQVGECMSATGQFEAARPWFEHAAAAKEFYVGLFGWEPALARIGS